MTCRSYKCRNVLIRRRPDPDRTVYLATSNDLSYDPACPERYTGAKQELDALRATLIALRACADPTGDRL